MKPTRILAAAALVAASGLALPMASAQQPGTTRTGQPRGPGSVSGAPDLPAGFAKTFASWYVDANGLRFHAVNGGRHATSL
jgi:hypothetical protein